MMIMGVVWCGCGVWCCADRESRGAFLLSASHKSKWESSVVVFSIFCFVRKAFFFSLIFFERHEAGLTHSLEFGNRERGLQKTTVPIQTKRKRAPKVFPLESSWDLGTRDTYEILNPYHTTRRQVEWPSHVQIEQKFLIHSKEMAAGGSQEGGTKCKDRYFSVSGNAHYL